MLEPKLKTTGQSSTKLGDCEVCKKHCSEVFLKWQIIDGVLTYTFGHEECLK